ncbi:hypothetical protein QFZ73_000271 [Peribacillus sp. V2I11]|nr:hypothetical protein [Peribacillus sp. V2I11]
MDIHHNGLQRWAGSYSAAKAGCAKCIRWYKSIAYPRLTKTKRTSHCTIIF